LRLWDLETGETLGILKGHTAQVTAVRALADGHRALSGSYDRTLRLWRISGRRRAKILRFLRVHGTEVSAAAELTPNRVSWFPGRTSGVSAVAVLPDGSRALSGSDDHTLWLWDPVRGGGALRILKGHTAQVRAVDVLADSRRALSGSDDHTLRLWDLEAGECLAEYSADAQIGCVAFARDDLIVAGFADGKIHILEIREPQLSTNAD
jgi:WD40 repeat protein